jgi:alkanesulfonate monooxygenase SsuD/methylene tetrahydromethanopterin reductase-like flavin-dependent oxidoreductase (luciferase family)
MRHGLYFLPAGELSDPRTLIELGIAAEEHGWDGLFLWDHILRPTGQPQDLADVWVALSAVATVTSRIRLGPMVTPTARRRPQILARQAITLDHLSLGRLIVGLGLGVDTGGELSKFGEVTDPVARGDALDEAAELLASWWSGERASVNSSHYRIDDVELLPRPLQRPRIPMWFAARGNAARPVRRAARYDGVFAIEIDRDGLRRVVRLVAEARGHLDGFDVAVHATPGEDLSAWEEDGATWAMWSFPPGESSRGVRARIEAGPSMRGPT